MTTMTMTKTKMTLKTEGDTHIVVTRHFAAPPEADAEILSLSQSLGLPITEIGAIAAGAGVRFLDADGTEIAIKTAGWRHF